MALGRVSYRGPFYCADNRLSVPRAGGRIMEKSDLELIMKHMDDDKNLAQLYNEHLDFEKKLEVYDSKVHLTPDEEN